jgi:hypothetical protein
LDDYLLQSSLSVSVAGCLGYDVLAPSVPPLRVNNQQLKLLAFKVFAPLFNPAHHNLNNQQLKQATE